MSEEETINTINDLLEFMQEELKAKHSIFIKIEYQAVKTLLDLYQQEKKTNDIDLTIVYMNGFYDGEDKWKKKIKEKIDFYKRYGKIENSNEYVMSVEIEVLEELLEEK